MTTKLVNPIDQFVIKHILIISKDDAASGRISFFAAQLKGAQGDQRIEAGIVETLKAARHYIKSNSLNIIFIDPDVADARSVLNFVKEYRETYKHIVWVVFSSKNWWQQNQNAIQSHAWGNRFSKYYRLPKKHQSNEEAYRHFVFILTACHWDFVLQLLSEAAHHIKADAPHIMTPDQVKKFVAKGMAPLQSLSRDGSGGKRDAFVSMPQRAPYSAQYKIAIEQPLRDAGYNPVFMGDARVHGQIPEEVFSRIEGCSLFFADVTGARPSVLIEIGYALAKDVPRILVRNSSVTDADIPFLIQNRQIPQYITEADLEDLIRRELKRL